MVDAIRAEAWAGRHDLVDVTDYQGDPGAYMTKAELRRAGVAAGLVDEDLEAWVRDPLEFREEAEVMVQLELDEAVTKAWEDEVRGQSTRERKRRSIAQVLS